MLEFLQQGNVSRAQQRAWTLFYPASVKLDPALVNKALQSEASPCSICVLSLPWRQQSTVVSWASVTIPYQPSHAHQCSISSLCVEIWAQEEADLIPLLRGKWGVWSQYSNLAKQVSAGVCRCHLNEWSTMNPQSCCQGKEAYTHPFRWPAASRGDCLLKTNKEKYQQWDWESHNIF